MLQNPHKAGRIFAVAIGVWIVILGGSTIFLKHNWEYMTWFGQIAFAPFAILIGLLAIAAGIFVQKPFVRRRKNHNLRRS